MYKTLTDRQWELIEPMVGTRRPVGRGRPPVENRAVLDAILYVLRTGIIWNHLPADFECSASTAKRAYKEWVEDYSWQGIWTQYIRGLYEEKDWDALDGWLEAMAGGTVMAIRVGTGVCIPTDPTSLV